MFFDSVAGLARVAIISLMAYGFVVILLRIAGKRSLAKLNAFDFVVTVAFGSVLATVVLSKDVPLAQGALAFAMLAALQYFVSRLSVRFPRFGDAVRAEPTLLFENGRMLERALAAERVTKSEMLSAIRRKGFARLDAVAAVVLETDGSLSVIGRADGPCDTLDGVRRID